MQSLGRPKHFDVLQLSSPQATVVKIRITKSGNGVFWTVFVKFIAII